jgi:hypothetical protein
MPNWRQFAAIPFCPTVAATVKALAIEVPPEGRPTAFAGPAGFMAACTSDGNWVVLDQGASRFVDGPAQVISAAKLTVGTPHGDALRQWLGWWGWQPASTFKSMTPPAG